MITPVPLIDLTPHTNAVLIQDSIPANLDISLIDDMPQITDRDAFAMCRKLSTQEGLLCGGSTGVNVHAAVELAKTLEVPSGEEATIVCIAPDSGVKYLSKIYNDRWLKEKGLLVEDPIEESWSGGRGR